MRRARMGITLEAPALDSVREINVWPILAADTQSLVAEIERGDHDGYLGQIRHADKTQHGGRPAVQAAIANRYATR